MDVPDTFFINDAWAQEAGIELIQVSAGRSKLRMRIAGWHKNSHGTVHGGAIFTLADTAFALASNSHGVPAAAINAHITYTVTVTDDAGEKIAIFQGMAYRKIPKVEKMFL